MKLNWLGSLISKGVMIILVSTVALLVMEEPGVIDTFWDYVYLFATVALCSGILVVAVGSWEYFFGSSGIPNYIYRPKQRYLFVRYSTCPFKVERNGAEIRISMVLAPITNRKIALLEKELQPKSWFKKYHFSGRDGDNTYTTENGQKLTLTRGLFGIRVSWDEKDSPWKIE